MKVFHGSGFSNQELTEYRSAVYATVVELAQEMVRYMKEAGLECVESSNQVRTLPSDLCLSLSFSFSTHFYRMPPLLKWTVTQLFTGACRESSTVPNRLGEPQQAFLLTRNC